jgi:putative lipoic acid-binding regulatory protein
MDGIGIEELDAASGDILDATLELSGPCAFPFGIDGLVSEALIDLVCELVTIFSRQAQDLIA